MKLVKAAAVFWHVVRGIRSVFDAEWPTRVRAFWAGIKRSGLYASSEQSPLLLADVRSVCIPGEAGLARLCQAVAGVELPAVSCGFGFFLEGTVAFRRVDVDRLFGVRRASEVAASDLSEVCVDLSAGTVDITVRRWKNDQFGVGQLAHIVSPPLWGGTCPVRLLPG